MYKFMYLAVIHILLSHNIQCSICILHLNNHMILLIPFPSEGFERLAAARRGDANLEPKEPGSSIYGDLSTVGMNNGRPSTIFDNNPSELNVSAGNGDDSFDMFAEDDENANGNSVSDPNAVDTSRSNQHSQSKFKYLCFIDNLVKLSQLP